MFSPIRTSRFRGIGLRLTIWHAAVLCTAVLAISLFLYYRLERDLYKQHDVFVELSTQDLNLEVQEYFADLKELKKKLDLETTNSRHYLVYRLHGLDGRILIQSDSFPDYPSDTAAMVRTAQDSQEVLPCWTAEGASRPPYRMSAQAVRLGGKPVCVIEVGYSLRTITHTLENCQNNFLRILIPLVLVGIAGGWWLARKSLAPIASMTAAAETISRESLGRRLPVKGAGDELDRLAQVLNDMLQRIQESFERIERFSSDLAHELRTPLTALKGEAERALVGERSADELRSVIAAQAETVESLNSMIADLLLLSRRGSRAARQTLKPVDVSACVRDALDTFQPLAEEAGLTLRSSYPEIPPTVEGDASALRRVFCNLLDNAIKHTPARGTISVDVRRGKDCSVLVSDTGSGIAPEDIEHVFERFYRGDPSRSRETGGVGLGLSISRQIVEDHRGSISIRSELGEGTEVTVPSDARRMTNM